MTAPTTPNVWTMSRSPGESGISFNIPAALFIDESQIHSIHEAASAMHGFSAISYTCMHFTYGLVLAAAFAFARRTRSQKPAGPEFFDDEYLVTAAGKSLS
jgi:hypothetical protein